MPKALFISKNLIGDGLYIGPALRQWHKEHPNVEMHMLTDDNYIKHIYTRMGVPINVYGAIEGPFDFVHTFDVSKAFELCDQKKIHVAEAYAELLGVQLEVVPGSNYHVKPIFEPTPEPVPNDARGVILISMFSASCASRQGLPPNKMLPWKTWQVIIQYLRTLDLPLRVIGGAKERAPLALSEDEYLLGVSLNKTALIMQRATFIVTVDNGMGHLAASQETPTFLFYPACLGTHYILPRGNPNLHFMHMDPVKLHPAVAVTLLKRAMPELLKQNKIVV